MQRTSAEREREAERDRQSEEISRGQRRAPDLALRATFWFVLPILIALCSVGWARYDRTSAAVEHLTAIAATFDQRHRDCLSKPRPASAKPEEAAEDPIIRCRREVVDQIVAESYPTRPDPTGADARAAVVVRSVASELARIDLHGDPIICPRWLIRRAAVACTPRDPASLVGRFQMIAARQLYIDCVVAVGLVAFLLSAVAGLFIADVHRAKRQILALRPSQGFTSMRDEVAFLRNLRVLDRPMFFTRRVGFALLMGTGGNYLLAPLGIQATIIGEFTKYHPITGSGSAPYWVDHVKDASPVACGFYGFMVYSLLTLVHRATSADLSDRIFVSLLNRGIVVLILSMVLSGVTDGGSLWRAVIFFAGIFPQTGLEALAKVAQVKVAAVTSDEAAGFEVLPEIDLSKQQTLRELGIDDANDLARADLREVLCSVGIEPGVLLRAVDRAILIHALGVAAAAKLEAIPVHTACELVAYVRGGEGRAEAVAALLRDKPVDIDEGISLQVAQLEREPNVELLIALKRPYAGAAA